MLYKGYAEAICSIRDRKGLTQKQAAEKASKATGAKIKSQAWSKFETGAKRLGASELPIILAGLGCSETELWQESVRMQSRHYFRRADEVREEAREYGTSMAAGIVQGLWALDLDALPIDQQSWFRQERNFLANSLSSMFSLVDLFKDRYWNLIELFRRADHDYQDL